ncbi:MAG: DNA repair protein RadC [Saprospiraceae bacterium]|nr:DNA repair protein RadC [Saprospiraceae bacterium]
MQPSDYNISKLSIKSWAEEDRPREKMLHHGRTHLTDAELLAILLGSGSRNESALDLSKRILSKAENNLHTLGTMSLHELMQFKGVGEAKAITISAALELGRRRTSHDVQTLPSITCSGDSFKILYPLLADHSKEYFWVCFLNRKNLVIHKECISSGGISGTVVDVRLIFKKALEVMASAIVLAHNHPSGNLNPSDKDRTLTRKLYEAGKLMDIMILDHIIIAGTKYYSFADNGLLS